jgi:hypothetical protein
MRKNTRCALAIVAVGVALTTPIRISFAAFAADSEPSNQLSAGWSNTPSIRRADSELLISKLQGFSHDFIERAKTYR